jgi:hypothetical protein
VNAKALKILVFFTAENEEISTPPSCGFLIGIYKFYDNWSIGTFRKKGPKKWDVCSTCLSSRVR